MANEQRQQTREQSRSITKTWYMVTSPHTVEECMQALDQVASMGQQNTSQWRWGCMNGDHTGYAFVQADSPEQALRMVPDIVRAKAQVEKVDEFTIDQIRGFHNK
jgi:hypothetical protein